MKISFEEKCPVFSVSSSNKQSQSSSRNASPYSTTTPNSTPYPTADQAPPYPQANLPYPPHPLGVPVPNAYPTPNPTVNAPYPVYQPYQPPYMNMPSAAPSGSSGNMLSYPTGTIQASHIRVSLLSAIEDKIRQRLRDQLGKFVLLMKTFLGTSYAEFQSVDINLQELKTGQQRLREILENIQRDQKQMDAATMTYKVS